MAIYSLPALLMWLIDGGNLKFRVVESFGRFSVEMKGGGTGWMWGPANFSTFDDFAEAEYWAVRWSEKDGGIYVSSKG